MNKCEDTKYHIVWEPRNLYQRTDKPTPTAKTWKRLVCVYIEKTVGKNSFYFEEIKPDKESLKIFNHFYPKCNKVNDKIRVILYFLVKEGYFTCTKSYCYVTKRLGKRSRKKKVIKKNSVTTQKKSGCKNLSFKKREELKIKKYKNELHKQWKDELYQNKLNDQKLKELLYEKGHIAKRINNFLLI
jgi:hypothetical protein